MPLGQDIRVLCARLHHGSWEQEIFPLAERASSLLLGGPSLGTLQNEAVARLQLTVADVNAPEALPRDTHIVFTSDAVFSPDTLRALSREARKRRRVMQACIRAGTPLWHAATRHLGPVEGDLPLPLWAGPLSERTPHVNGAVTDAFPDAERITICDEDGATTQRVAPHGRPPHLVHIPRVQRLGGRVCHWLDVLDLSLAALETRRMQHRLASPTRDRNRNVLGDVDIHPTATVLGSILEDGVKVEAHASIINTHVGKDVLVADHSVLHTCVIGSGCRTLVDTSLRRVVAMPRSTLSNLGLSDTVIGGDVFLTTAVAIFDPHPGTNATVDGIETGRAIVGAAIGARAVLGTRALLASGTTLPPDILIVARPGEAVVKTDDDALARAQMMRGNHREHA